MSSICQIYNMGTKPEELSVISRNYVVDGPKSQVNGDSQNHHQRQPNQYLVSASQPHFLSLSLSLFSLSLLSYFLSTDFHSGFRIVKPNPVQNPAKLKPIEYFCGVIGPQNIVHSDHDRNLTVGLG